MDGARHAYVYLAVQSSPRASTHPILPVGLPASANEKGEHEQRLYEIELRTR